MKSVQVEIINNLIKREKVDTNAISDGYHTFGELYDHRIELFIALCKMVYENDITPTWRCQTDDDWFIMGIGIEPGKQITYHIPMNRWDQTTFVDRTYDKKDKPEWDGHTSQDVLNRLKQF